jgi:hypothetical protein
MSTNYIRGGLCAATLVMMTGVAQSQVDVLLVVDLSVPNQVTLNSTAGLSAATVSGSDGIGVYLDNFYGVGGGALNETLVSGDITNVGSPSDGTPNLFRGGGGTDTGLNLFSWSDDPTVDFIAGTQAFTGSGTWTLDADDFADMLNGNSSGNLYFPADDSGDVAGATLIGSYRVIVPAPGAASLLGLGFAAAMRRRR